MSSLMQGLLILHVVFGILGLVFFLCLLLCLTKAHLRRWPIASAFLGTISFWLAWIAGGAYYTRYYGKNVKPLIVAGDTPWVHTILMEAKEHIFLFLPFLSLVALLIIWKMRKEIETETSLRKSLEVLLIVILILGLGMTFAGILISSAGGLK